MEWKLTRGGGGKVMGISRLSFPIQIARTKKKWRMWNISPVWVA